MTKTPKFLNFRVHEIIKRLGVFCVKKNYEKEYGVGNNYSKNIEKLKIIQGGIYLLRLTMRELSGEIENLV
jgi:hypothetical protein